VAGECFMGEFQKKFEDFADVYLVVVEPGVVEYAVYATLEMLLAPAGDHEDAQRCPRGAFAAASGFSSQAATGSTAPAYCSE